MRLTKIKIAAVVPTFNRKESLIECLDALLSQTFPVESIILIDNASTDGTEKFLIENGYLKNSKIDYVILKENIGGSGGFCEGMKRGYEKGFDWLWLMDDDALPAKNALESISKYIFKMGEQSYNCVFWNQIVFDKKNINNSNDNQITALETVESAMFVGFAINKALIKKIGFPHGDYFMYWDDIEYSNRARKNGGNIKKIINSKIYHKDWAHQSIISRQILGRKMEIPDIPKWKFYYLTRNELLMNRSDMKKNLKNIIKCAKNWVKVLLMRPNFLGAVTLGILHGLLGLSGKRISLSSMR